MMDVENGFMMIEAASLQELRDIAYAAPRRQQGLLRFNELVIEYDDLLSTYMEVKNIFFNRIYDFKPLEGRDATVLDGGAHIGIAALRFHALCPDARLICFEPDPTANAMLRRNLERNGVSATVVDAGLDLKEGEVAFAPDGADGGRIVEAKEAAASIRTERLSPYIGSGSNIVKLNIEGMELPVLQELVASGRLSAVHRIVLEYHGWPGREQRLGRILELLDAHHFRYVVHDFDEETNPTSKPPFRPDDRVTWFALVCAERLADGR